MNEAREFIIARFIAAWGVSPAWLSPYAIDNESYNPQSAGTLSPDPSWVRMSIAETIGGQETLGPEGSRRYLRRGVMRVEAYCLPDRGTARADGLMQAFRDAFEGVTFSGLHFTGAQVVDLGIEGPWWRVNGLSVFQFEERK